METSRHVSDSTEQRDAELIVIAAINASDGLSLTPERIRLPDGAYIELDGMDRVRRVLCEVYCRIGALKAAQAHKVSTDILKLAFAERELGGEWRKIVAFVDRDALRTVSGRSWRGAAARSFGVELMLVELSHSARDAILTAQARQVMVNAVGAQRPNPSLERP